jgi:hypothetical protein
VVVFSGRIYEAIKDIAGWYAGGEKPHPRHITLGLTSSSSLLLLSSLPRVSPPFALPSLARRHQSLDGLNQHIVQRFECIGTDFSKALVALERGGNRRQRGFAFDLQPAFDQPLNELLCMHGAIGFP